MRTVTLEHDYPATAEEVWALATDLDSLKDVMNGIVTFEGLPSGRIHAGQTITVQVSLFGKLPPQPYFMEILECDDKAMTFRTSERGAGVKSWCHTLSVKPLSSGSRLRDEIEIDAGWMTWSFALWARFLYRKRHKPRLRILSEMQPEMSGES